MAIHFNNTISIKVMKNILLSLLVVCLLVTHAFAQSPNVDSILQKIAVEKDEDKKVNLIISIWATGVDRDPNLTTKTGQAMLKQGQEKNDIIQEASAYCLLGTGYRVSGNPIRGLALSQKALILAEKAGNYSILAMTRNQMGHTYRDREEYENAFKIYADASADAAKAKNEIIKIWPVMNMGVCYLNMDKLDSSLKYLQRAYELSLQINKIDLAYILWNLGGVHSKLGNAALSVTYYNMAIQKATDDKRIRQVSFAYMGLAEHYQRMNQPDSCMHYAKMALTAVQRTSFFFMSSKPAKMLADMYEKNNCESTLKYAAIYKNASDSSFSQKANQQIQMMTFDEDLRQQEVAAEKVKEEEQRKQNIQYALLAFGIIVFVMLFLSSYRKKKTKRRARMFIQVRAL